LNILHISDVHFGVLDSTAEQPRIAEALIEAAHKHGTKPDICIFSGDLANFGASGELQTGERWLRRLVRDEWNADLIVVPGNHDVDRKGTRPYLFRAIAESADVYADWPERKPSTAITCVRFSNGTMTRAAVCRFAGNGKARSVCIFAKRPSRSPST
jgi:predicted MPP superfamily phosphohydrolase